MGDMIRVDARSLTKLARDLRTQQPAVYAALRKALVAEGQHVAQVAREKASWSSRIPQTIKPGMRGFGTLVLKAGGGKGSIAPHAKPYEHAGKGGTFRHPVYGDRRVWANAPARPFLHPAVLESLPEMVAAVEETVTRVVGESLDRGV